MSMIRCDQESLLLKVSENENAVHMLSTHAGDIGSHLASQCTFFMIMWNCSLLIERNKNRIWIWKRKEEKF